MRKIAIFVLLATAAASAQHGSSKQSQICRTDAVYRALDFWVGDWDIYEDGKIAGRQRVSKRLDGCAVVAEWFGPLGDNGIGNFAFDRNRRIWIQFWTTNQVPSPAGVTIRETDPEFTKNGMRFQSAPSSGSMTRMTLSALDGGRARQLLEVSSDSGKSWNVIFDAEHRRRKSTK